MRARFFQGSTFHANDENSKEAKAFRARTDRAGRMLAKPGYQAAVCQVRRKDFADALAYQASRGVLLRVLPLLPACARGFHGTERGKHPRPRATVLSQGTLARVVRPLTSLSGSASTSIWLGESGAKKDGAPRGTAPGGGGGILTAKEGDRCKETAII